MNPRLRITLNLLLPAPLGLVYVYGIAAANDLRQGLPTGIGLHARELAELLAMIFVAYCFAIIPSALFAGGMEYLYRRRNVAPRSRAAVLASTAGGLISGLLIGGFVALDTQSTSDALQTLGMYMTAGGLTGLTIGLIPYAKKKAG